MGFIHDGNVIHNPYYAYGSLLARYFDADEVVIAYSGRGLVNNWGVWDSYTMPFLYK